MNDLNHKESKKFQLNLHVKSDVSPPLIFTNLIFLPDLPEYNVVLSDVSKLRVQLFHPVAQLLQLAMDFQLEKLVKGSDFIYEIKRSTVFRS